MLTKNLTFCNNPPPPRDIDLELHINPTTLKQKKSH